MKKRILSVFLCCVLIVTSVFSVSTINASAATNAEIKSKMVSILYGGASGGYVSCDFDGYTTTKGRHEGIDFVRYSGAPIYSLISGQVIRVANSSSVGTLSTLAIYDSTNNMSVIYLHAANICVSTGSTVKQGQLVAYEGNRGSSAPHTHVEVRNGRQTYASKSVNDYTLENPNPYPYWNKVLFGTVPPDIVFETNNSYPTPITTYPLATSGKITLYDSSLNAYSQSTRHIAYNDLCTINKVYTNGYCSVTYPTSNGNNTEYAKTSDFIAGNVSPYAWKPSVNKTAYTRSDLGTVFGEVYTTDNCTVVGSSGSKLQVIYPISSGYKMGWVDSFEIPPSPYPVPLKGYNASPTVRTTVFESLSTMGTYWGQIFVDDECTLNSADISAGWMHVTYPVSGGTKSGYVYLDEFIPSESRLTNYYTTTVTQQTDTFRKSDMATKYGWVSVGDEVIVVGKSGNKLQVLYPLDAQYGGGYKIAWMYDTYIKKNLTGISVTSNPSKVTYLEGESLNTNGLVITAKYDDGSTANVTSSCTLSGYSNTPGVKTVTATYNGKQTAFTVTVNTKSPTKLTIESTPSKTVYSVGDTIETTGLKAKVTYNNNTYSTFTDVDGLDIVYDDSITATAGTKKITVSYIYNNVEVSSEFSITVKEVETPTPATYTISYNANGGTNAPASQTKTEDVNLVLTKSVPKRDGYTFKGWATSASSQTVAYKAGATYTANANATLYAVWEKNIDTNASAFVVSDVSAKAGSTVTVDISIKNNPGITAFNFSVDYPEEVMALTGVEYKTLFSSKASGSKTMTSPFIISWFSTLSEDETANGVIATLTFKVNEDVEAGSYPINLTYDENNVFDSSFTNIAFSVDNGDVIVTDYVPGDVNGDTVVNMKDIVLLQQYLNDWDVTIDESAANVNGDASVNMKDIVLLQQYLNDWDVELK